MRVRITKSIAGASFSFMQGEELSFDQLAARIGKTQAEVWMSEASGLAVQVQGAPAIERADLALPEKGIVPTPAKGRRGR